MASMDPGPWQTLTKGEMLSAFDEVHAQVPGLVATDGGHSLAGLHTTKLSGEPSGGGSCLGLTGLMKKLLMS